MLLYRVFLHDAGAAPGEPGSATYVHRPQGRYRWDNPDEYDSWYLAKSAEGAVGESFGNLESWSAGMFDGPLRSGLRRALATFSVPDDLAIFDLDDASNLLSISMRPTQVVIRNYSYTQGKAAEIFHTRRADATRRWAGISWWSFHRPSWTTLMLWSTATDPAPLSLESIDDLTLSMPAVQDAARALSKPL